MSYADSCCYSIKLLDKLEALDNKTILDSSLITKAIYWAKKYHGGQVRKSGEPFYSHPLEVAYLVSDYKLSTEVIVASILHDIVEDTEVSIGMLVDNFSWRIAQIVDRLTRDRPDGTKLSVEYIINNAYSKNDKDVLLIKLFDRLHNITTITYLTEEKQKIQITETIKNFLIFAEELHLTNISEYVYKECVNLNLKLKVISLNDLQYKKPIFDKEFSLLALENQNG